MSRRGDSRIGDRLAEGLIIYGEIAADCEFCGAGSDMIVVETRGGQAVCCADCAEESVAVCSHCNGTGEGYEYGTSCTSCRGSGVRS